MAESESAPSPKKISQPFHAHVTVENKGEVISKNVGWWAYLGGGMAANMMVSEEQFTTTIAEKFGTMMPNAMKDVGITMSVETISKNDNKFVLKFEILDYDMATLLHKGKGDSKEHAD